MLMPKRMKYRKQFRGRMRGQAVRGNSIDFGVYALVAMEPAWITSRQIEAARIAMTRHIKRGGKVWIRIFPDKPYTKKPLEQRMGKGKASVEGWVAVVKPGRVMFEMEGPAVEVAKEAMRLAMHKMPIRCKFVVKQKVTAAQRMAMEGMAAKDIAAALKAQGGEDMPNFEEAEGEVMEPTAEAQTPEISETPEN